METSSSKSNLNEKTSNEQEAEEKQWTHEKVKLENGSYNYVFSRNRDENNKTYWRCNICDVVVGGSLRKHVIGKKHQAGLALPHHPTVLWGRSQPSRLCKLDIKLAPGEPVPPGFEDEVRGVTEIQAALDAYHSGPLIGLEYLVELSVYEDEREPQYVCLLCDKRGDPRTVMAHLVSFNHRMSYLMTHFPTAYRALNPYVKQFRRNVQNVVTSICEHIERRFGRLEPQATDKESFERKKQMYMDNILKDSHPSERQGETFEFLIDADMITSRPKDGVVEIKKANEEQIKGRQYRRTGSVPGCKDIDSKRKRDPSPPVVAAPEIKNKSSTKVGRRSLSSISSISSSSLSGPRSRSQSRSPTRSRSRSRGPVRFMKKRHPENTRRSRSRSRSTHKRFYRRSRSLSRSPSRYRRDTYTPSSTSSYYRENNRLPWQRPDYARSRTHYIGRRGDNPKADLVKSDRMEQYRKQCADIEVEMEKILEQHERNPEKHSMYPDEWKKFWNRRYKELQAENKDPTKHDFKPEWIDFWNRRMKEMHDGEVKAKKDAIRKRLNLPEEPTPISFKIGAKKSGGKSSDSRDVRSNSHEQSTEPDVIIIEDSKDDEPRERKRSHSPWEQEYPRERERDRYPKEYTRDYYKVKQYRDPPEREFKRKLPPSPVFNQPEADGQINIVAVLRLLTALEEKLGSLGPRVIEILSQALALEKAEGNSSETLLDNEMNCVLFETVKEKLKGQLLAGMVESNAEKTYKNAIQKIAALSHYASERKKTKDIEMKVKLVQEPVKIPGIGSVDKAAIATQIANALVAQGKTDVTQAELEQLINAVVGMAQASHATGKPISTAAFVEQLSAPAQSNFSSILQSAIIPTVTKQESVSSTLQLLQASSTATETLSSLAGSNAMDSLSDSELKTLLQNFKDLSTDEQHSLITYLKKLEAKEPDRVERLRKFVKLGPSSTTDPEKSYTSSGRISPFSNREAGANPSVDDLDEPTPIKPIPPKKEQIKIDSDDEDYSFEDVFRAASKNVNEKQMADERMKQEETKKLEKPPDLNVHLTDAKMLIANLMGQLGKNKDKGLNLLGLGNSTNQLPKTSIDNGSLLQNYTGFTQSTNNFNPLNPNITSQIQTPVSSAVSNQTVSYNLPNTNQFRFTQSNPQLNANFDNTYSQSNYNNTQTSTLLSNMIDPNFKQSVDNFNSKYGNTYGQPGNNPRPQFSRQAQQFQPYDPRQNYY